MLYNRLRENPTRDVPPRTFFFSGKAAPAYHFAKLVIKFINNLGATIDGDPAMKGRLKVVFVPDYSVSIAERLIPASDVSEQISTAGYEASGTGNMKFMMNGALTIGTRDGATIEMAAAAGEENFFLFGLSAEEVANSRGRYNPQWHYDNDPETRAALDLIAGNHFSPERARRVRADSRRPASQGRPLPAPRRPQELQRGARAAGRAVRGPGELVAQGGPQHRGVQDILERPDHRGVRQGHLARRTVPGGIGNTVRKRKIMTRIAIHGFGRIGRSLMRVALKDNLFVPVSISDRHGLFSTIHAYTNTQALTDQPMKDRRDSWAATENIIPSSSGAARALAFIWKGLSISGKAYRVPTRTGSN